MDFVGISHLLLHQILKPYALFAEPDELVTHVQPVAPVLEPLLDDAVDGSQHDFGTREKHLDQGKRH